MTRDSPESPTSSRRSTRPRHRPRRSRPLPQRYSRPDKIAFGLDRSDAWPVKFWDTDTAMACMLLLLAAVDVGLGGWYFGIPYGEA